MKFLGILVSALSFMASQAWAAPLRISFDSIPKALDSSQVNSASEFRLLLEITARLTKYEDANVKGDIARSWKISKNQTHYEFVIEDDRRFSDGTPVTVDDVVASIKRSVDRKFGIHYDVEKILKVEKTGKSSFEIELKEPDSFFLQDLSNPEFAILSKEDQKAATGQQKFRVTTGPLAIHSSSADRIELRRNAYFPQTSPKQFDHIFLEPMPKGDREKAFEFLLSKHLDYFWAPSVNRQQHTKLVDAGYAHFPTRNAYTFWMTFNFKSSMFSDKKNRQALQRIFHYNKVDISDREPKLQATRQLYHPVGPGRLDEKDLDAIYSNLPPGNFFKGKTLKILTFKGAFYNSRICDILKKESIKCILVEFKGFDQYAEYLADPGKYDIIVVNNDFSTDYIRKSLEIALYQKRPLILVPKSDQDFSSAFEKSIKSVDLEEISRAQKEVARILLAQAYIVPLFYDTRIIYAKRSLNTSRWSTVESDFSVWKIER